MPFCGYYAICPMVTCRLNEIFLHVLEFFNAYPNCQIVASLDMLISYFIFLIVLCDKFFIIK